MIKSYSAHTLPQQKQSWHTYSVAKTLQTLGTNPQSGLDTENAAQRQQHYGRNEIEESAGRSNWEILLDQFTNIMLIMLIVLSMLIMLIMLSMLIMQIIPTMLIIIQQQKNIIKILVKF